MKRKLNTLELRRRKEAGGQQNDESAEPESPSKKRSRGAGRSPRKSVATPSSRGATAAAGRKEDPREHQNLSREEIALMCMEVSEKIDRCFDFDLQKWLDRYEGLRRAEQTNFPEAAMLIMSAAQIYGRKVDYLEEIIMHMGQDQKAREDKHSAEPGAEKPAAPAGRKRAARFQPQSLSDCFSDLEFSFVDKKTVPLSSLVSQVERIGVGQRNKFQLMQELCNELRTMPTKQRRQEILNRLRDEANIPPIMSSHTAARKNQVLDLESGETIGTRYDYQIYLNFIDVRTGSLRPEHDLKRFFQRCDVIDYLFEQQETERERCEKLGQPTPEMVFPLKPREFKMYIPPEYLRSKYHIQMEDTSDYDNELHRAKTSNFRADPMLELSKGKAGKEVSFSDVLTSTRVEDLDDVFEDSTPPVEPSEPETTLESSSILNDSQPLDDSTQQPSSQSFSEQESCPDPELMALEETAVAGTTQVDPSPEQSTQCQSRLSLDSADEGIGADRESLGKLSPTSLSRSQSLDKLSDCVGSLPKTPEPPLFFSNGTVVMESMPPAKVTISLKPAVVTLNLLKIPECHLRKHLLFALPPEYKKLKMDLVRKTSDRGKDMFTLALYSLGPRAPKNPEWVRRASTPELEDFHGFDEFADILAGPLGKALYSLAPMSDGQRSNFSRASTPEADFFGFQIDDDVQKTSNSDDAAPRPMQEEEAKRAGEPQAVPAEQGPAGEAGSQQSTPTRTMSRDSGISDEQNNDRRGSRSKAGTPEPVLAPIAESTELESALTSEKYLQSVTDAKELIEKVNSWHRKLKPILLHSEKRNHFDIHACGTEIIESFGPEETQEAQQKVINFAQVMENKQEDFTARYFLSMLMLANTNNVEIVARNQDPTRITPKEDIELKLLSRKRHHQEMESMGERIPCDNGPVKVVRGKKRKRLFIDDVDFEADDDAGERLSGIRRLRTDDTDQDQDDGDQHFLDRIRLMYPDINGQETMRKRIAFRRGMRRCAYGLSTAEQPEGDERIEEAAPVAATVGQSEAVEQPEPVEPPPAAPTVEPEVQPEQDDPDEILSVDLQTHEAVIVAAGGPMAAPDEQEPCCSKSLFSTAESGFESMLE